MKQCAEIADLLSAYADGQAVPAQIELLEGHLERCSHCRAALKRHQETLRLLALVEDVDWEPPDLRLRVAFAYAGRRSGASRLSILTGIALSASVLGLTLQIAAAQHVGLQATAVTQPSPMAVQWRQAECPGCLAGRLTHNAQFTVAPAGPPRTDTANGTNGTSPAIRQLAQDAQTGNDQSGAPPTRQATRGPLARVRGAGPVPM